MNQRIGKYLLTQKLGSGGMGTVWKAFDEALQRDVAVKLMHNIDVSDAMRERFRVEARTIARLRSEHVVDVYDFNIADDGRPYIVMEFLRGETLGARLSRLGPLPPSEAIPVVVAVAEGLGTSHGAGIIHRDLKPQNVFLRSNGRGFCAKILDFGVALVRTGRCAGDHPDDDQPFAGTPGYMSPEQILGQPIDERSDLWALGVLCYELLAGKNPFAGPASNRTMLRIVNAVVPPISTLVPGATPALDEFFVRALAKAPDERYQSAYQFGATLVRLLEGLAEQRKTKVLVVDDEPDTCLLIEQSFEEERDRGALCFAFAGSGDEALKWLSEHGPADVILTDLNMPKMDGLTLLERVLGLYPTAKSIVVTAYGDMGNVRKAMNHGAFDFLVKPLDLEDLASTVSRAAIAARDGQGAIVARQENAALRELIAAEMLEDALPRLRNFRGAVLYEDVGTVVSITWVPFLPALPAGDLVEGLNTGIDTVTAVFERFDGVMARLHGEYVTSVFRGARHAERAVQACLDARDAIRGLVEPCAFRVGYGVSTGCVIAATVGAPSRRRFECSVLGPAERDAMTLSRWSLGDDILVSRTTWELAATEGGCVALDRVEDATTGLQAYVLGRSGALAGPASAWRMREINPRSSTATARRQEDDASLKRERQG